MAKPPDYAPWLPAKYERADVAAMQALVIGEADPGQQTRALDWIIQEACHRDDMSYQPASSRDSDFAEGKRYVGNQIVKLTKLNIATVKEKEDARTIRTDRDPDRDPAAERADKRAATAERAAAGRSDSERPASE